MKYTKEDYLKYVKRIKASNVGGKPVSFKKWKELQPASEKVSEILNKWIKKLTRKLKNY